MRGPHNIFRLIRTGATLERTGAMKVILDSYNAPWGVRLAAKILGWPFQWLGYKGDPNMPPATRALTALGPAYIKFGQILSTRPDVVGDELAVQMRVLQDKLPPFPMEALSSEWVTKPGSLKLTRYMNTRPAPEHSTTTHDHAAMVTSILKKPGASATSCVNIVTSPRMIPKCRSVAHPRLRIQQRGGSS